MQNSIKIICFWLIINVNAQASPPNIDEYFTAAAKLEKIISENVKDNKLPLVKEAHVANLIDALSDQQLLKPEHYKVSDLGQLLDICDKANALVKRYLNFNLTGRLKKSRQTDQPLSIKEIWAENVEQFQNEFTRLQPFLIHCVAAEIPLLEEFMHNLKPEEITSIRIDGIKKARTGMLQLYTGVLQTINNEKLKVEYRLELVKALSASSSSFARFIQVSEREKIINIASEYRSNTPEILESYLDLLIHEMEGKDCKNLCNL